MCMFIELARLVNHTVYGDFYKLIKYITGIICTFLIIIIML